jgi:signal transduction histidine kinase
MFPSLGDLKKKYTPADSLEVLKWYARGFDWESIHLDSAMACYNKGLEISRKKGFIYGEVKYYFNATAVHRMRGNLKLAHQQNQYALGLAFASEQGELKGKALINLGISYSVLGKLDSAYQHLSEGLIQLEAIKDSHGIAVCYSNMGKIKADQSRFEEAYELNKKAISLHEKGFGLYMYAQALNNLGNALWKLKRKKEAEMAYKKAYQKAQMLGDLLIQCTSLSGQAEIQKANRNYDGLKKTGKEIFRIADAHNMAEQRVSGLYVEMLGYYYTHDYSKALKLAETAYSAAVQDSLWEEMERLLGTMGTIFIGLGELEKSDSVDAMRNALTRKILSEKVDQNIEVTEARLQSKINQLQVNSLKKEKALEEAKSELKTKWIWTLIIGLILLLAFVFVVISNQRKQQTIAEQERKIQNQKLLEMETQSQLGILDSLIKGQEMERARIARDLHDGLGGLLSGVKMSISALEKELHLPKDQQSIFENALLMLENATTEMRQVARNMMPDALLRFGLEKALQDYCGSLSAQSQIQILFSAHDIYIRPEHPASIPAYRIVQELVNNALKHSQASQIIVQLSQNLNQLWIEVEDNGKGFDSNAMSRSEGTGFDNLQNRVSYLKGKIDIRTQPGKGSSFFIEIPI